jgi:rubrerythrin
MNSSFKQLSRSNVDKSFSHKVSPDPNDVSKVQINVVGNWSSKRGPTVALSIQQSSPKKQCINQGKNDAIPTGQRTLKSFNLYLTEEDNVKSVNEYNDELPDKIEGTYKYDFNIIDIHDLILKRFERQRELEVKKLEEQLSIEEKEINGKQNMVERKSSIRRIEKIKESMNNILTRKDFDDYINKIRPLIEQYNMIGTLSKIVSFATNKKKNESDEEENEIIPEDNETQKKRHQVIFDFLEIARKYIEIDLVRDLKEGHLCESCGHKLEDVDDDEDSAGLIICPNCRLEKISVVRCRFYKDNTRTNNSGNNYEDRANFEKGLMRFQGKQTDKPPLELYETLENYFREKELLKIDINNNGIFVSVSSEYIRNNVPLNDDGEKMGTSRPLMYKALKDTGNSAYYDHINLILHEMWDWELPDIAHLEDQIMEDYDKSQRVYEALPKDRKSSLNSQFRLFKHLRRLGYQCISRNFRIPSTHDILEFHENIWAKICEILGWENL